MKPDNCHFCEEPSDKLFEVGGYKLRSCPQCWSDAKNGWATRFQPLLFGALNKNGLLIPDRNQQGLLPRDYAPPADFNL